MSDAKAVKQFDLEKWIWDVLEQGKEDLRPENFTSYDDYCDRLGKMARELADEVRTQLLAERDAAAERLRAALDACDMVMDTASILGLPQELPQVYKDSWAAAHIQARAALVESRP